MKILTCETCKAVAASGPDGGAQLALCHDCGREICDRCAASFEAEGQGPVAYCNVCRKPFQQGDPVMTPAGLAFVRYVRFAPPSFVKPEAYSVKLACRSIDPRYSATVFPASNVKALP